VLSNYKQLIRHLRQEANMSDLLQCLKCNSTELSVTVRSIHDYMETGTFYLNGEQEGGDTHSTDAPTVIRTSPFDCESCGHTFDPPDVPKIKLEEQG
jgi:hypothetical protein